MPTCSVLKCKKRTCTSSLKKDGVSFHIFPKSPNRKVKWANAMGQLEGWIPTSTSVVCSKHFANDCFDVSKKNRRTLMTTAIPTLNLTNARSAARSRSADTPELSDHAEDSEQREDPSGVVRLFVDSSPAECRAESAQQLVRELRALHDRVARLVPELGTRRLALHFRDDNNDEVEYIFTSTTRYNRLGVRHANITCDECGRCVEGPRYKCVACADYDLCGACEALGLHHQHALMRITKPLQTKQARKILKTWCNKMREEGGEERLWTTEEAPEDDVSKRSTQKGNMKTDSNNSYKPTTTPESSEDSDDLSSDKLITVTQTDVADNLNPNIEVKLEPMEVETEETASCEETESEVFLKSIVYGAKEFDPLSTEIIKEEKQDNPAETSTAQETLSHSHQSSTSPVPPTILISTDPRTASPSRKIISNIIPVFQNIVTKTALPESGYQRAYLDSKVKRLGKPVRTVTCKKVLPSTPPPQSAQAALMSGVVPPGAQVINLPHGLTLSQLVLDRATVPAPVSGAPTSTSDSSFATFSHTKRS